MVMKIYQDPTGAIHERDEQFAHLLPAGSVEITRTEAEAILNPPPSAEDLTADVIKQRKEQEAIGVIINGVRYSGEPSNRQAIAEAIDYINATGTTAFTSWKDSDNQYHRDLPAQDVIDAYLAIGARRAALIAKEASFAAAITAGSLTDLSTLDWTV